MSSNEKPTLDLDQLAIIRGLLERQESKLDNVGSKVDLLDTRFRNLETTTEGVRTEVKRLNERMTTAEGDIRGLRDKDATILSHSSNADLAHEAAIGGAIAHVQKLEGAVEAQAKVNEALCDELGLNHAAIVLGEGRSVPPPGIKVPKTRLAKIATENKFGTYAASIAAGLTFLIIVAKIIAHVLGVHID